jgi:ATP-dependent DNA ligase
MGLAGIVAKRADSRYVAGRSNYWQKIKTDAAEERERERRPH